MSVVHWLPTQPGLWQPVGTAPQYVLKLDNTVDAVKTRLVYESDHARLFVLHTDAKPLVGYLLQFSHGCRIVFDSLSVYGVYEDRPGTLSVVYNDTNVRLFAESDNAYLCSVRRREAEELV